MSAMYLRAAALEQPAAGQPIRAVLTTSAKQADGLALQMSGARLDRFRANPALLVAHDHRRLPVGNVLDLEVEPDRITGRLSFAPDAEAQLLEQRVRAGVIRAVSIGFDVDWSTVDQLGNVGSWELTEASLVGVPMDAEALVYARSRCSHGSHGSADSLGVSRASADALLAAFGSPRQPAETLEARVKRLLMEELEKRTV